MPLNPTPDSLPKAAHVPDLWLAASECLAYARNRAGGAFILIDELSKRTVGAGVVR